MDTTPSPILSACGSMPPARPFCLCIDDFGIQYHSKANADHLIHALCQFYKITIHWEGKDYCGLHLDWNYTEKYIDISMPGYINCLLLIGSSILSLLNQLMLRTDGTNLHMTRPNRNASLTTALHCSLNKLSSCSSPLSVPCFFTPGQLIPPCSLAHSNATIWFHASDMCLHVDTNAAYLVLPRARNCIARHFFSVTFPTSSVPYHCTKWTDLDQV